MSTLGAVRAARPAWGARTVLGTAAVATGVGIVLTGVALPWVTMQHGREAVNGLLGDGAYLSAASIGAGALWAGYLLSGRPGPMRALAAGAGFLVLYWTLFDMELIVRAVTSGPLAGGMGGPLMGPGPLVAAAGGAVLLGATLSVPSAARGLGRSQWLRVALAAALLAAGAIHLQQAPEHLELSTTFGLGFVAAAVSQLTLGAAVLVRGGRMLYAAIVVDCALFFALLAFAVLHGLPFPAHEDPGLRLGSGESLTLSAALGALSEAAALGLALLAAVRTR